MSISPDIMKTHAARDAHGRDRGWPNVGKSTLFNRITHGRRSIVGDEPGITRDRIAGAANFEGRRFELVDTGGIVVNDADYIPTQILKQAKVALEHASR